TPQSQRALKSDPRSLRDTMLAVAALLHIEAIKMESANPLAAAGDRRQLREVFAGAACSQLDAPRLSAATKPANITRYRDGSMGYFGDKARFRAFSAFFCSSMIAITFKAYWTKALKSQPNLSVGGGVRSASRCICCFKFRAFTKKCVAGN